MNMIGKLLSSIVAEDLTYMCERYGMLPDTHFGGRPGKNTSDAMHYLANRVKGAWRRHKVAAVLFLDIEGAFPNAVTERLLHNMRTRQVPEPYVSFIERMLTNRRTRLKFDGFTSDWVNIDNGIVQGDPLSMLLYLFYNADLIASPNKDEAMLAYVDDACYYAEGLDFGETHDKLRNMMCREQGGFEWSKLHNSRFEPSKMALVGFSRKRKPDPQRHSKSVPEPRPSLQLRDAIIKPSPTHKYLGVIFDQELRWREQTEHAVAKAAKWTLQFRRLTRPSTGIRPKFMRQLYCVVAIPRFTYAADVWYAPVSHGAQGTRATGSVGATKWLESIQRIAITAISGALCTMATDVMEAHTNLPPVELLMHRFCHRATIRLATLPISHPLHKLVQICARRRAKWHLSPIHLLLRAYNIKPSEYETFSLADRPPNGKCIATTNIATSREESKEVDLEDHAALKVYTDRSGQDSKAGATAVLFKGSSVVGTLQYHLGSLEHHTTFEAKLLGILLGLWLVNWEPDADSASLKVDSQAAIQALNTRRLGPGGYLLTKILELSASLCK